MPKITVFRGRDLLFTHYVDKDETIIGRSQEVDVPLDSAAASRRHARIRRQGRSYVIEDLGTKNGMFVNGTYTPMKVLKHGDSIEIAQHRLEWYRPKSELREEQELASAGAGGAYRMKASDLHKELDERQAGASDVVGALEGMQATAYVPPEALAKLRDAMALRRSAHLAFHAGGERRELPLDRERHVIGFEEGCDVRLPGKRYFGLFGGTAAELIAEGDGKVHRLRALSFWTPVKVDGKKVSDHVLKDGETFTVGGVKLRYRDQA